MKRGIIRATLLMQMRGLKKEGVYGRDRQKLRKLKTGGHEDHRARIVKKARLRYDQRKNAEQTEEEDKGNRSCRWNIFMPIMMMDGW